MEIDFQTSDHVAAMENVAKQRISRKCSMCNSFQVISDFTHSASWIDSLVIHYVVAMKKVVKQYILTKCSKCNTFQVIIDLVHDFINFNALKLF